MCVKVGEFSRDHLDVNIKFKSMKEIKKENSI